MRSMPWGATRCWRCCASCVAGTRIGRTGSRTASCCAGVRDVRDYRIQSPTTGQPVAVGSPFNISAASLRMGDFDRGEVETLLGQHTDETGQHFEPAAVERVYAQTAGQPWLVNALCWEA